MRVYRRRIAAVLLVTVGAIHLVLAPGYLDEHEYVGILFVLTGPGARRLQVFGGAAVFLPVSAGSRKGRDEMKSRSLRAAGSLGALALVAVVGLQAAPASPARARASTAPAFRAVCGAGPIRCMSLIR